MEKLLLIEELFDQIANRRLSKGSIVEEKQKYSYTSINYKITSILMLYHPDDSTCAGCW